MLYEILAKVGTFTAYTHSFCGKCLLGNLRPTGGLFEQKLQCQLHGWVPRSLKWTGCLWLNDLSFESKTI